MKLSPMGWALLVIGGVVVVGGAWYLFFRRPELPESTGTSAGGASSGGGTDWRALFGGIGQVVGTVGGEIASAADSANRPRSTEGM